MFIYTLLRHFGMLTLFILESKRILLWTLSLNLYPVRFVIVNNIRKTLSNIRSFPLLASNQCGTVHVWKWIQYLSFAHFARACKTCRWIWKNKRRFGNNSAYNFENMLLMSVGVNCIEEKKSIVCLALSFSVCNHIYRIDHFAASIYYFRLGIRSIWKKYPQTKDFKNEYIQTNCFSSFLFKYMVFFYVYCMFVSSNNLKFVVFSSRSLRVGSCYMQFVDFRLSWNLLRI